MLSAFPRDVTRSVAPGAPSACVSRNGLPDAKCTPGAVDSGVRQANIHATICSAGYTAKVRPPVSYTEPIKKAAVIAYGNHRALALYELDHLIPLELGGAPRDPANLWPQPWAGTSGAHAKDQIENTLHARVCAGTLPLSVAQHAISSNWETAAR